LTEDEQGACEIEAVSAEIRAALREPAVDPRFAGALSAMLARLADAHACRLRDAARERARVVAVVYQQLERLRACDSVAALVSAAAPAALACADVDRVFLSRVRGASYEVLVIAPEPPGGVEKPRELALGRAEREALRRRRAVLVTGLEASGHPLLVGASAYVAVAVASAERPAELLVHADRTAARPRLGDGERQTLEAFADGLGLHLDGIRLHDAVGAETDRVQASLAAAARGCQELAGAQISLDAPLGNGEGVPSRRRPSASLLFSAREVEVIELMARGHRNAEIAEQLVLSETTVKGHVTAIMRKLHASSRAEAVARYLRLSEATPSR
jgi:DNA-binding CsgD family transcriptional regulator